MIDYYLLASFIFVLLIAVIFLFDRLKRSRERERENAIQDREQRLFRLYQNLEEMINSLEEYVDEAKKEFSQEVELAQKRIRREEYMETATLNGAEYTTPILPPVNLDEARELLKDKIPKKRGRKKKVRQEDAPVKSDAPSPEANTLQKADIDSGDNAPDSPDEIESNKKDSDEANANNLKQDEKQEEIKADLGQKGKNIKTGGKKPAAKKSGAISPVQREDKKNPLPFSPVADNKKVPSQNQSKKSGKIEDVRRLHNMGLSNEKIARELSMSLGEINLIISMLIT